LRGEGAALLALPPDAPESAQVAISFHNGGGEPAVVRVEGLWLLPAPAPREQCAADSRGVLFENVSADESEPGGEGRRLALNIAALAENGRSWPEVKFNLQEGADGWSIEFRRKTGGFERWPGGKRDVYRISGPAALAEAIAALPSEADRRLLGALAQVLPDVMQTLAARGDLKAGDGSSWLELARAIRDASDGA